LTTYSLQGNDSNSMLSEKQVFNKLAIYCKYDFADNLANKINDAIANNVRNQLNKLVDSPVNAMWEAVRNKNNAHKNNTMASHLLDDVEQVYAFFASFSNDSSYKAENVLAYRPLKACDLQPFYAFEIEPILRRVVKTAPGRDNILRWVFSACSFDLAEIVTHIFNSTLRTGVVPN